jgi:hypothetical protein
MYLFLHGVSFCASRAAFVGAMGLETTGFDKEKNVAIEHVDTIETPDGRVALVLERRRPQRIKSAIKRGKIQDIGKFKTYVQERD